MPSSRRRAGTNRRAYRFFGVHSNLEGSRNMTGAPREVIAHSQFDDETREMLLGVYDHIERHCKMTDAVALAVVDRILAIAETGQRLPEIIVRQAAPPD
jgi:hypothetical protein